VGRKKQGIGEGRTAERGGTRVGEGERGVELMKRKNKKEQRALRCQMRRGNTEHGEEKQKVK
jgi:hypothetical protein